MDNKQLESKVMERIKSGQVKLRSRYIFLAEKLGLGSVFVLNVLFAVLFFSLMLFYLRASDNLFYLSFGSLGLFAFLESFPYLLVVSLIIFILVAGLIIKKSDISYQKPFGYLALGLLAFILLSGTVLTFTSIAEKIQARSVGFAPMEKIFRPFGNNDLREGNRGVAGRVIEVGARYVLIQTPQSILKLNLVDSFSNPPEVGQFVVVVGEMINNEFNAQMIRQVNESEMQMIRNSVHRRFGPLDSETLEKGRMIKACFDDCPRLKLPPKDCKEKCLESQSQF
jgi:hypothetical protein